MLIPPSSSGRSVPQPSASCTLQRLGPLRLKGLPCSSVLLAFLVSVVASPMTAAR
jgi:hypothetical protein